MIMLGQNCQEPILQSMVFWSRDHKLGISTKYILPLYDAAKHAFMAAVERYKGLSFFVSQEESGEEIVLIHSFSLQNFCAIEVMKHSRTLLLLSSDVSTAWNIRRWVIKMIAGMCSDMQEIVEKESYLAKTIAEKSKMNYSAWNHRCWLVQYMSSGKVMHELIDGRVWAGLNIADNSCFHYRTGDFCPYLSDTNFKSQVSHGAIVAYTNRNTWLSSYIFSNMVNIIKYGRMDYIKF